MSFEGAGGASGVVIGAGGAGAVGEFDIVWFWFTS